MDQRTWWSQGRAGPKTSVRWCTGGRPICLVNSVTAIALGAVAGLIVVAIAAVFFAPFHLNKNGHTIRRMWFRRLSSSSL